MTKTEEQLSEALKGIAELVHGTEARTVPIPEGRSWRPNTSAWLVPVAVAAAVLLVVVVGVVAAAGLDSPDKKHGPAARPAGVSNRFFMSEISGSATTNQGAAVRDVITGKTTAIATMPEGVTQWSAITATADNIFYLASAPPFKRAGAGDQQPIPPTPESLKEDLKEDPSSLYRVRIDGAGKVVDMVQVKNLAGLPYIRAMAASPDGKRLAVTVEDTRFHKQAEIAIYDLAGGHRQSFRTSGFSSADNMSWSADGRWLAFEAGGTGVRILDTRAGNDLLKASRLVATSERGPLGQLITPVLGADGTKLYVIAAQPEPKGGQPWSRVIEVDAASGRQLRVLFEQRFRGSESNIVWMFRSLVRDPADKNLLVVANGYGYRIDIATGQSTRIPFPEGDPNGLVW